MAETAAAGKITPADADILLKSKPNISEILSNLGLDPKETLEKANSVDIDQKYLQQTEIAKKKKIFGSPTFIYKDEIFWGDDRLEDCIKWAKLN